MSRELLTRAVDRTLLADHDGRSGATIERIRLDDGTRLVLKRATPQQDLTVQLTGGLDRERLLWVTGELDRLPPGVGHAIIDVWDDDGATCTLMRDVSTGVPGWTRVLDRAECSRVVTAMAGLHTTFADDVPPCACPLATRLGLLSPRVMAPLVATGNPLPSAIVEGWQRFAEIVDDDLLAAVDAIHRDSTPLATAMCAGPVTLLHADLWLVNLALQPDDVVILDWAVATAGPAAFDLTVFLTGSAAHVAATKEELLAAFAELDPLHDEHTLDLALLASLADMGWNKALDATTHQDASIRARERADLEWWCATARRTLDRVSF